MVQILFPGLAQVEVVYQTIRWPLIVQPEQLQRYVVEVVPGKGQAALLIAPAIVQAIQNVGLFPVSVRDVLRFCDSVFHHVVLVLVTDQLVLPILIVWQQLPPQPQVAPPTALARPAATMVVEGVVVLVHPLAAVQLTVKTASAFVISVPLSVPVLTRKVAEVAVPNGEHVKVSGMWVVVVNIPSI